MKSHTLELPRQTIPKRRRAAPAGWTLANPAGVLLNVLAITLPAATIILLAVWSFGASAQIAAAGLWAAGFIFLALAVDSTDARAWPLAVSGVAILLLTLLSAAVATEFGVLGGFLVAAWTVYAVSRRLP